MLRELRLLREPVGKPGGPRYNLLLDNAESRSLADYGRALKPGGTLILNSGTGATGIALLVRLLKPLALSPF